MQSNTSHTFDQATMWGLFVALIFLIPASPQMIPPALPVGSFYVTAVEIIIFGFIGLWVVRHLLLQRKWRTKTLFGKYVFAILLFYAFYIVVGLFEKDPMLVLGDFRQYLPLVMYIPMIHIFQSEESFTSMRKWVVWVLLANSLYVSILFLFFKQFLIYSAVKAGNKILVDRIFFANTLFVLFAYLGCLIASVFDSIVPYKRRLLYLITIVGNAIMLLFMQARSLWAIFTIIILLSAFSIRSLGNKIQYVLIVVYSMLFIVSVAYISFNIFNYKPEAIERIESSVIDRVLSFSDILKIGTKKGKMSQSIGTVETRLETAERVMKDYIVPNWFLGIGLGGQIPMVSPAGEIIMWKYQIDNGYLTILAKFGLIGFALYFLFAVKLVMSLIKLIRSNKLSHEDMKIAKSFLLAIFAMALGSFFSSIFIRHQTAIVGFVVMLCEIERMNSRYSPCERVQESHKQRGG